MSSETKASPGDPAMPVVDRIGQLISGRYRIVAPLGEGGMGIVYLAEHTHMKKRFALKLLHAEMAEDEEVLARFRREAESAAHIEHPNVVAATDFGKTEDGLFFLVLEYVDGTSLRKVMEQGPVAPARALKITRQIALALGRAHDAGIVHRDMKPENVMLVQKGDDPDFVKVLDFGVARVEARSDRDGTLQPLTRIGTIMGTPEYMAPEQALAERVTPPSDLYAVGVVLFEMLAGKHPFDGDQMAMLSMHIVAPVPEIATRAPNVYVAPAVEALVRKLLEKDAKNRYPTGRALVDAIDEAALASNLEVPIGAPSSDGRASHVIAPPSTRGLGPVSHPDALANTAIGLPAATLPLREHALATNVREVLARIEAATKLPRAAVIAIVTAVPFFLGIVLVALVVSGGKTTTKVLEDGGIETVASAKPSAPPDQVRAAAGKGTAALEELAEQYPSDVAVLRELAFSYDREGRTTDALKAIRRAVETNPTTLPRELVRVVARAASKFETVDDAFALLEGHLGADGAEALYELTEDKDVPDGTRARAAKSLAKPTVRAKVSPEVLFLLDLGGVTSCEGRRDVLGREGEHADSRALPALRALKKTTGCGRRERYDCNRCLRSDGSLERAIRAAESHGS